MGLLEGIVTPVLTLVVLTTSLSAVPRELKCGENDPRRIYPHCMFGSRSRTLWCDESDYEKLPSVRQINSHLFDVDCRTAKALFVNDSCLRGIDREDMEPFKKIRIFLGGQNFIRTVKNATFHGNKLLREIDLAENDIHKLEKNAFRGLRQLIKLYLSDNIISHIDHLVLRDLKNLEELSMENNFLEGIHHPTFRNQRALKKLNLRGNRIARIDDFAFEKNPNVQQLQLDGNEIEIITVNTFAGLQKLEILTLSYNRIKHWPQPHEGFLINIHTLHLGSNQLEDLTPSNIANMAKLQNLMLDNNSIASIREDLFQTTPRLVHINLSANRLEDIPEEAFNGLCYLESLILTKNKLRTPKEGWFMHLANRTSETTHTKISDNLWLCDCDVRRFKKFHDFLKRKDDASSRILFKNLEIKCHGPKFASTLILDGNVTAEIDVRFGCPPETEESSQASSNVCGDTHSFDHENFDVASQYVPQERRPTIGTENAPKSLELKVSESETEIDLHLGVIIGILLCASVVIAAIVLCRRRRNARKR